MSLCLHFKNLGPLGRKRTTHRQDKIMFNFLQVAQREDKALWVPLTLSDKEQPVYQALLPDEPLALLSGNASMEPGLSAVDGCTEARA